VTKERVYKGLGSARCVCADWGERVIGELPSYEVVWNFSRAYYRIARTTQDIFGDSFPNRKAPNYNARVAPSRVASDESARRHETCLEPHDREARVSSRDISGTAGLFLNVAKLGSSAVVHKPMNEHPASLMSLGAPDVVIDIGMSRLLHYVRSTERLPSVNS